MSLGKAWRFLLEINTLYAYIFHRLKVKVRTWLRVPPVYPTETGRRVDPETQKILEVLRGAIPDRERGDNPAFSKDWKNVYDREATAATIAQHIAQSIDSRSLDTNTSTLSSLREFGFTRCDQKKLPAGQVADILSYLEWQNVYPSHVAHFALDKPRSKDIIKKNQPFGSYDLQTTLRAPHVTSLLADPQVLGLIAGYFGCLPTIASVNLFWSFLSRDGKSRGPQRFHRDVDDYKTCTLFMNLTDTSESEGSHCYVKKSHVIERLREIFRDDRNDSLPTDLNPFHKRLTPEDFFQLSLNGYTYDKLYEHFFKDQFTYLYGERGSVVVTDNFGIHRGVPDRRGDRLVLWVSFALTATHAQSASVKLEKRLAYSDLKGEIANNSVNRYVLRNIIDFSA